jgi:hypothetical protein
MAFTDDAATTSLVNPAFDQERIMSTHACSRKAGTDINNAGSKARRVLIGSDARAITIAFTIIAVSAVAPFALLSKHFAPNVAADLRRQSEVLSQDGDRWGAIAASRRAVDIYRGLTRAGAVHYTPKLAASLHELSIRLYAAGDDAGALAAIREAVQIRRGLVKYSPTDAANLEQSLQVLTMIEAAQRGELPHTKIAENVTP